MANTMTKAQLIDELSVLCDLSKQQTAAVLDWLAEIVYREAENGFLLPNLCKFEVVKRKPRRCRDPRTGASLMVGEHKAVRVKPLKRAKDRITPMPDGLVTRVAAEAEAEAPQDPPPAKPAADPPPAVVDGAVFAPPPVESAAAPDASASVSAQATADDDFIYFQCDGCGQEIEAPSDMAGTTAACPACGTQLLIPVRAVAAAIPVTSGETSSDEDTDEVGDMDALLLQAMKRRTIRIELAVD